MAIGDLLGHGRTADFYAWGDGEALKLYRDFVSDASIEHEARVGRIVAQSNLSAPGVGERVSIEGRRGLLFERIDGISMLQAVLAKPWTLNRYAAQFGALHAAMHNTVQPELPAQRRQLLHALESAMQLSPRLKDKARRRLATLPDGVAVCHGDYHPDNVLLSARGPVIIDWVTVSCGNPAADVARTTLLFLNGGLPPSLPRIQQLVLGRLRRLYYTLYLRAYRRRRPMSAIEISVWLPIMAAARLSEGIDEEEMVLIKQVEQGFG